MPHHGEAQAPDRRIQGPAQSESQAGMPELPSGPRHGVRPAVAVRQERAALRRLPRAARMSAAATRRIGALLLGCSTACAPGRGLVGAAGLMHERSIYTDDRRVALRAPEGVSCAADGKLIVADTGNGRLLTYMWKDGQLRGGEQIRLAQLPHPTRVQRDAGGGVLVLDGRSRRIVRVDPGGAFAGHLDIRGASGSQEIVPISFTIGSATVYV